MPSICNSFKWAANWFPFDHHVSYRSALEWSAVYRSTEKQYSGIVQRIWRSEKDQHLRCETSVRVIGSPPLDLSLQTNTDGVITVGFADVDQADACCRYMNERIWHARVILCQTWDGNTHDRFPAWIPIVLVSLFSGTSKYDVLPSTEVESARLDQWHQYLIADDDDDDAPAAAAAAAQTWLSLQSTLFSLSC